MKKTVKFLIVFVIILFAISLIGKNFIIKAAVKGGIKSVTGLQMDIEKMEVGILNTQIGINEIKLHNPPDFPEGVMIYLPEIYVNYALDAFISGTVHLEEVRIDLKELIVIKDRDGRLNLNALNVAKKEKGEKESGKKEKSEIRIDELDLKIGEVVYKDFSLVSDPKPVKYNVNLHEKFHNITDLDEMGKLILVKALLKTNIAGLANFDIDFLQSGISESLTKATDISKPVTKAGEKAAETVEGIAEDIKEKLRLPLGK
jgi:uncharacterized protein involved in outer membrane biogenesis